LVFRAAKTEALFHKSLMMGMFWHSFICLIG
jgi:hypothetical protein